MGGGPGNVPKRVCMGFLVQTIFVVIGIVLIKQQQNVAEVAEQNTNTVTQVVKDWNTLPIIDIQVTDDKCKSGYTPFFSRNWGGSEQGCLVNKIDTFGFSSTQTIMTNSEYDDYVRSRTSKSYTNSQVRQREPCTPISMQPSKSQDEFFDMRFCAKHGFTTFA